MRTGETTGDWALSLDEDTSTPLATTGSSFPTPYFLTVLDSKRHRVLVQFGEQVWSLDSARD